MLSIPKQSPYLGISESLMYTLVDVYFENAYNASLLLQKDRFLESLAQGTVEAHLILSVCAYAANFYRTENGEAPLRDHGFMIEWAKRAGSLVFQDAESLCEDNIVTFCVLGTFWYAQGSWRLSYLHKANACNLLHIAGFSLVGRHAQNSVESEIRRRRFWACYIMQCALMEDPAFMEQITDVSELPLPSSDAEIEAGQARIGTATIDNGRPGRSIYAELIRAFKLWYMVFSLVKLPGSSTGARFTEIYALDDALTEWWTTMQPEFRLTPTAITNADGNTDIATHKLPLLLLMNTVYHQSMCALHASVVPLFSWTPSDDSWASARQASAQKTYEHACSVSDMIATTLITHPSLTMTHSFIAYAAYSGCAVQIPFTWSSNPVIKRQATTNVGNNMKMIQRMAPCWKFAALVQKQLGCLYHIHERLKIDLEDEPKHVDVRKLLGFKINSADARISILGFTDILRSKDHGYANTGEENNSLGLQDNAAQPEPMQQVDNSTTSATALDNVGSMAPDIHIDMAATTARRQQEIPAASPLFQTTEPLDLASNQYGPNQQPQMLIPNAQSQASDGLTQYEVEQQSRMYDVWPPFFHPTMLDVLSDGEMLGLPQVDVSVIDFDYLDSENWFMPTTS